MARAALSVCPRLPRSNPIHTHQALHPQGWRAFSYGCCALSSGVCLTVSSFSIHPPCTGGTIICDEEQLQHLFFAMDIGFSIHPPGQGWACRPAHHWHRICHFNPPARSGGTNGRVAAAIVLDTKGRHAGACLPFACYYMRIIMRPQLSHSTISSEALRTRCSTALGRLVLQPEH